ncbi:hypothetical protein RB195_005020 [Necator americanus]|uniref:Reverse transcriptase domain-containing protein n=1 Tax=Necator americanus TaxID=51031 RepID=A0ABR1BKU1_NECAM
MQLAFLDSGAAFVSSQRSRLFNALCAADTKKVSSPSRCPLTDLEYADGVVIFTECSTELQHVGNLSSKLAVAYSQRLSLDRCKQVLVSSTSNVNGDDEVVLLMRLSEEGERDTDDGYRFRIRIINIMLLILQCGDKDLALIFGSIFALLNCIFAFYNLFQIALAVVRKLDGMKKKVNLAEKALKERRLPPDLYARLQDTADTQIETQ